MEAAAGADEQRLATGLLHDPGVRRSRRGEDRQDPVSALDQIRRRADFDRGFSLMVVRPSAENIRRKTIADHPDSSSPHSGAASQPLECETISFLGGSGGRERSVAWLDGPPGAAPYPIC